MPVCSVVDGGLAYRQIDNSAVPDAGFYNSVLEFSLPQHIKHDLLRLTFYRQVDNHGR